MNNNFKGWIRNILYRHSVNKIFRNYRRKFFTYSFVDSKCVFFEQYQASITRLYHTIEKGLSYNDYHPGFGKSNINSLIYSMEQFSEQYGTDYFFYQTALDCLHKYLEKNKEHGYTDNNLEEKIRRLSGERNACGGTVTVSGPVDTKKLSYGELVSSRHSIRHFSKEPVDLEILKSAIKLAQYTPSACNRQGWRTRIIADQSMIRTILANQNGNRGFGEEIDKLLIITADLRAQQKNRELFQVYIDGGMYAESVLNSLYYKEVGSVPLSAALTAEQERNVRETVQIDDAEVLILFIGVGHYPDKPILTTRSERRTADIRIF